MISLRTVRRCHARQGWRGGHYVLSPRANTTLLGVKVQRWRDRRRALAFLGLGLRLFLPVERESRCSKEWPRFIRSLAGGSFMRDLLTVEVDLQCMIPCDAVRLR